jgi:hypothetical protein
MTPCPKPEKPIRGTVAARRHMARVAELCCVICRWPQVQVHHVIHDRFANRRASDFETIPLCVRHHTELHADKTAWREQHGPDYAFLDHVTNAIYGAPQ